MEASTLHLLWSVVEATPSELLTEISQERLVNLVVEQIENRVRLSQAERLAIRQYLRTRLPLIQDSLHDQVI
jgi:hypothetical protein